MVNIVTHVGPHYDEIIAMVMLILFGEKHFPGIRSAKIKFVDPEEPGLDGDEAEKHGFLMIGVGHGRFDEHPKKGCPQDLAKKGKCAATLVADFLGLSGKPEWDKLLTSVTANDLDGLGSSFDIAYILKLLYDFKSDKEAAGWAFRAVVATFNAEKRFIKNGTKFSPKNSAWFFDRVMACWLKRKFGERDDFEKEMEFIFANGDRNVQLALKIAKELGVDKKPEMKQLLDFAQARPVADDMFGLKGVPFFVYNHFLDREEGEKKARVAAVHWADIGIDAKWQEQVVFFGKAVEDFKRATVAEFKQNGKTLKLAAVDNCTDAQFPKYARSRFGCQAALVIVQTPAGNVQIYSNKYNKLDVGPLAEALRLAEQEALGTTEVTDAGDPRCEGMLARWYYHWKGQMLLNGSKTSPSKPTMLSLEKITELALKTLSS